MLTPPLTAVDGRSINSALARISEQRIDLDKATRAGLDVQEALATLDAFQFQLETVKKEFLPNMP